MNDFIKDYAGKIFRLWLPENSDSECYWIVINNAYDINSDWLVDYSFVEEEVCDGNYFARLSEMKLCCLPSDQEEDND